MLIGVRLSDLGVAAAGCWRSPARCSWSRWPRPSSSRNRRCGCCAWLLAILFLGGYWLSFLADLRGRLGAWQLALASLFGVLAWLLVLAMLLLWPQLLGGGTR